MSASVRRQSPTEGKAVFHNAEQVATVGTSRLQTKPGLTLGATLSPSPVTSNQHPATAATCHGQATTPSPAVTTTCRQQSPPHRRPSPAPPPQHHHHPPTTSANVNCYSRAWLYADRQRTNVAATR